MIKKLTALIQCTVGEVPFKGRMIQGRRCRSKYCQSCLKKKYGEDLEGIKAKGRTPSKKSRPHVEGEAYIYQCVFLKPRHFSPHTSNSRCPKCRDICSCSRCRKLKGLEPLGYASASVMLACTRLTPICLQSCGEECSFASW
jgi:Zinc-finger domain of monoamine-oxidase A repressor R1